MNIWRKFLHALHYIFSGHWPGKKRAEPAPEIKRHENNPALSPIPEHDWEARGAFNPAAALIDGRVHILYRAIGNDGVSRIGYASSSDGLNFDERLTYPVFSTINPRLRCIPGRIYRYDPAIYTSGGSWGGCEDPRMVEIDNQIHVTFNAFDGWDFMRIGAISLNKNDFLNKKWRWNYPSLISPKGQRHKNWILFPEKINGKFAILHSLFGVEEDEVRIEYTDNLNELKDRTFKSPDPHQMPNQKIAWHYRMRSVGAPPVRTNSGWLVFYQAMEESDPNRYKVGVMLLDLRDPTKIIARSPTPILEPDMDYENDWKPGIVYVSGALIKDDKIFIYYGGGDKHTCVAYAPLEKFLLDLKEGHRLSMSQKTNLLG